MKFLKHLLRHRYRIDRMRDGRYVVREKEWWHIFGPYLSVAAGDTLEEALSIIEWHKNLPPEQTTIYRN